MPAVTVDDVLSLPRVAPPDPTTSVGRPVLGVTTAPGGYEGEGIFGQTVSIFPKDHVVVVINSAWPTAWDDRIDAARMKYLAAIRAAAK